MDLIAKWLEDYGYSIILAIAALIIGLLIIRLVSKLLKRKLKNSGSFNTKTRYLIKISSITLELLLIFTIIKGVVMDIRI